jgi:hypothetical protein
MTKGNKITRGYRKVVHPKKGNGDEEDDVEIRGTQCYFY